jgi:hypothetical protein
LAQCPLGGMPKVPPERIPNEGRTERHPMNPTTTDQKTELLSCPFCKARAYYPRALPLFFSAISKYTTWTPAARPKVERLKEAENEWTAVKWARLGDSPHDRPSIERIGSAFGPDRYAVRRGSACLSKDGEWEYEPMPSNRDVEFFARCRFETFDAARQALAELEGK